VNTSQVTSSTFTDTTVSNWTIYYYVVTAVDDSGNESETSSEIQVCPHPEIANGTVSDTDCSITCDPGYNLNPATHSCVASGGGGFVPSSEEEEVEEETLEEEQPEEEVEEKQPIEKPIEEMTIEELKAKIQEIQQLIAQLQAQLEET